MSLQYFLNTAYKEFITEEAQYRGKNPTRPVTMSGQQKTHLEQNQKINTFLSKIIMKKYKQLYKYSDCVITNLHIIQHTR